MQPQWDESVGSWPFKKPRGRAPNGKEWDAAKGEWVKVAAEEEEEEKEGKEEEEAHSLPPGWQTEARMRRSGCQEGRTYQCYRSPCGKTFYSKAAAQRFSAC